MTGSLWQCTMLGVGIAWASILSMPYAMLSSALPAARMGVYMGIFNFCIVLPEILASLALEPVVKQALRQRPGQGGYAGRRLAAGGRADDLPRERSRGEASCGPGGVSRFRRPGAASLTASRE